MNRKRSSSRRAWDRTALRDPHSRDDKAARVEAMFNAIAPTYQRVNTLASLGRDAAWRKKTVAAANVRAGDVVLDVCCGTGDMVRTFAAGDPPPRFIVGIDFAANMLAHARYEGMTTKTWLLRADAQRLPLADESVDVVSCAFGVRNFQDLPAGLSEMYRVARPGGRVLILEFAQPEYPVLRWGYRLYCRCVLPLLAALIARDRSGAYRYLPRSIETFEPAGVLAGRLVRAGFVNVTTRAMNFRGVVLYRGQKP
jgi:demethylmenaquinone methyltransferase/2-methoxy-6-polyprenyl-1,4-benzoquinol methylase